MHGHIASNFGQLPCSNIGQLFFGQQFLASYLASNLGQLIVGSKFWPGLWAAILAIPLGSNIGHRF